MKRLILMRHAKSDWAGGPSSDHDRPLNPRGRNASAKLGDWLRVEALIPDQILCSSAIRTRETCLRLELPDSVALHETKTLYLASAEQILTALKAATGDTVLMIGHNPGCAMLADMLLAQRPDHEAFDRFPTCATLIADFDISSWRDLKLGTGTAVHFTVPRDLTK